MAVTTIVDPVPRIEGHLKVTLVINAGVITNASLAGTMFRGFENFIIGQNPLDAPLITQRICGVCPTAHAMASVLAMDDAAHVQATPKGRLMRNLIHGAEYIHSHLLHSYHLAAQDYIDASAALGGALNKGPWAPVYGADRRITGATLDTIAGSYVAALGMRRKAHSIMAYLSGKQPHGATIIGGGCSATPSLADIDAMRTLTNELKTFITGTYIPEFDLLFNTYYPDYFSIGVGSGKLLSYGCFRQTTGSKDSMLIKRGVYNGTVTDIMDHNNIVEDVTKSWYSGSNNLHPSVGTTNDVLPSTKPVAYSWLKSPRYKTNGFTKDVYEVGPLARMVVSGAYSSATMISVADRELSRTTEALIIANAMLDWLDDLEVELSGPSFVPYEIPADSSGVGLTEAIRGAIGHWVSYDSASRIAHYQIITPTCWNASPVDADGIHGTIEQALIGTAVADASLPIEALRVIHSYDPCLACAVHVIRDDGKTINKFIV